MAKRGKSPDVVIEDNSRTIALAPSPLLGEPIEATLEPPEDEDGRRGVPQETVVINARGGGANATRVEQGAQYRMVRAERRAPSPLIACMGANSWHRYHVGR